jgi:D-alanyl-D-alanine carboxypeptidase
MGSFAGCTDAERDGGGADGKAAPSAESPANGPRRESGPEAETPQAGAAAGILLVNSENPLPEAYRPEALVRLYDQNHRYFQLAKADIEICETVFEAMDAMFAAAHKDGVTGFIVTSGYRTRAEQQAIFSAAADGTAAKPGESEHETGLAFDVTARGSESFESTPQFAWLFAHCAEYGFILRYPKGLEAVTGYPFESWHYRYVGEPHAANIMDKGIALEQYVLELEIESVPAQTKNT